MKLKQRICGIAAFLSFMYLLGVAGSCDLGAEPELHVLIVKALCGLLVLIASIKLGGFTK